MRRSSGFTSLKMPEDRVKMRFLTPLPRFSSIVEPFLGPAWGHLAFLAGHFGPQDGSNRGLRGSLEAHLGVAGLGRNVHEA